MAAPWLRMLAAWQRSCVEHWHGRTLESQGPGTCVCFVRPGPPLLGLAFHGKGPAHNTMRHVTHAHTRTQGVQPSCPPAFPRQPSCPQFLLAMATAAATATVVLLNIRPWSESPGGAWLSYLGDDCGNTAALERTSGTSAPRSLRAYGVSGWAPALQSMVTACSWSSLGLATATSATPPRLCHAALPTVVWRRCACSSRIEQHIGNYVCLWTCHTIPQTPCCVCTCRGRKTTLAHLGCVLNARMEKHRNSTPRHLVLYTVPTRTLREEVVLELLKFKAALASAFH